MGQITEDTHTHVVDVLKGIIYVSLHDGLCKDVKLVQMVGNIQQQVCVSKRVTLN